MRKGENVRKKKPTLSDIELLLELQRVHIEALSHEMKNLRLVTSARLTEETCSVLLIAPATVYNGTPVTFSWTFKLKAGEAKNVQVQPYRPVVKGGFLISIGNALLSNVRVGDMLQQMPTNGISKGPVCSIRETLLMGHAVQFTLELPNL